MLAIKGNKVRKAYFKGHKLKKIYFKGEKVFVSKFYRFYTAKNTNVSNTNKETGIFYSSEGNIFEKVNNLVFDDIEYTNNFYIGVLYNERSYKTEIYMSKDGERFNFIQDTASFINLININGFIYLCCQNISDSSQTLLYVENYGNINAVIFPEGIEINLINRSYGKCFQNLYFDFITKTFLVIGKHDNTSYLLYSSDGKTFNYSNLEILGYSDSISIQNYFIKKESLRKGVLSGSNDIIKTKNDIDYYYIKTPIIYNGKHIQINFYDYNNSRTVLYESDNCEEWIERARIPSSMFIERINNVYKANRSSIKVSIDGVSWNTCDDFSYSGGIYYKVINKIFYTSQDGINYTETFSASYSLLTSEINGVLYVVIYNGNPNSVIPDMYIYNNGIRTKCTISVGSITNLNINGKFEYTNGKYFFIGTSIIGVSETGEYWNFTNTDAFGTHFEYKKPSVFFNEKKNIYMVLKTTDISSNPSRYHSEIYILNNISNRFSKVYNSTCFTSKLLCTDDGVIFPEELYIYNGIKLKFSADEVTFESVKDNQENELIIPDLLQLEFFGEDD